MLVLLLFMCGDRPTGMAVRRLNVSYTLYIMDTDSLRELKIHYRRKEKLKVTIPEGSSSSFLRR